MGVDWFSENVMLAIRAGGTGMRWRGGKMRNSWGCSEVL
jgi:hypothetical protein